MHVRALKSMVPGLQTRRVGGRESLAFTPDMIPMLSALGVPVADAQIALDKWLADAAEIGASAWSGLEKYRVHFAEKLRPYQKEMVQFLALRSYAINADPMRCLAGDTMLRVYSIGHDDMRGGGREGERFGFDAQEVIGVPSPHNRMTSQLISIETLFRKRFALAESVRQLYLPSFSCEGEGAGEASGMRFAPTLNSLWAVHRNGRMACFKVSASVCASVGAGSGSGSGVSPMTLVCTANHRILTPTGMKRLSELRVGDAVCLGRELGEVGVVTITSIAPAGMRETYDLTMESPLNNYSTASGFIVANSGKTPTTLAAATLVGAEKVLVACPSIAKLVWATEIVKWLGESSLLLYGRAGDEAREFCATCNGTGRVDEQTGAPTDSMGAPTRCPDCRAKNGQSLGARIVSSEGDAVADALARHRFIIVNYDILIPQVVRSDAGVRSERKDLPGWVEKIRAASPGLIIADEAHLLRGRSKRERAGESRRDRLLALSRGVPRFWALTGTPIYGRVADLWALLDVITDGLFGRPFFDFDVQWAGGHKGEYGWVNDGCTNAESLMRRLDFFMLKRDRRDILPHLPPKTRQVIRIDAGKESFAMPKRHGSGHGSGQGGGRGVGGLHSALRVTASLKEKHVTEAVLDECAEGAKVVVYSYLRASVESLAKAVGDAGRDDVRLRSRNFQVWCVSGDTPVEARFKQAQTFREWSGSGVFVATIDSVPVAISLKGAQSVHFADLTFDPASLLQAEDRPYEVGTPGLAIVYYVVEKSIDEHVVELVLKKMSTLENVARESTAGDFKGAFNGHAMSAEEMAEDVWARMEAAALGGAA